MRGLSTGSTGMAVAAAGAIALTVGVLASYSSSTGSAASCSSGTTTTTQAPNAPPNVATNTAIKVVSTTGKGVDSQQALVMHFAANMESGGNPTAIGAGSVGLYQIQLDAHPGVTAAQAADPVWSTNYMAPEFRAKLAEFNQLHSDSWSKPNDAATRTGPLYATEQVAMLAERPQYDYIDYRGLATVTHAYNLALKQLAESGISTDLSGKNAGTSAVYVSTEQGGCQSSGSGEIVAPDGSNADKRQAALMAANSVLGKPYAWAGGNAHGPTYGQPPDGGVLGFDCSGLVLYALGRAYGADLIDRLVAHSSQTQYTSTKRFTTATSLTDLKGAQPGDLVFFTGDGDGGTRSAPGHVGLYIGNGRMIQAPQSGELVQVTQITGSSFWASEFVAVTDPYRWLDSLAAS